MIDVTTNWIGAVIVAAACGGIGGVVYELLQVRHGDSGMLELVSRQHVGPPLNRKFVDWGAGASIVVGMVAAVAFLYFMAPQDTTTTVNGAVQHTREYDPFKLIGASLIVGSAGASFIQAMQQKLLALVNATQLQTLATAVQQTAAAAPQPGGPAGGAAATVAPADVDQLTGRLAALRDLATSLQPSSPK